MNTIELLLSALRREELCYIQDDPEDGAPEHITEAIAAGEAELKREPVGFLFQHSETGRTRVVMKDDVMDASATWFKVGPLYLGETK